jgi:hypothetical protein
VTRSYTDRLLTAQRNGAVIVCSMAPWQGQEVTHDPRHPRDGEPWTVAGYRFSGRFCHATVRAEAV